jgi:hypothetical protein
LLILTGSMRWEMHVKFWLINLKGGHHLGDLGEMRG